MREVICSAIYLRTAGIFGRLEGKVERFSFPHRSADHLQDAADSVVAGEAAFIERGARDGCPVVAGVIRLEVLWKAGEGRIVLVVAATHFVNYKVERRN